MNKTRRGLLAASFLLPLGLLLLLCALLRLEPFGNGSLVCADASGQYISYYAFYRDLFFTGKDALYSMEKVLGGSTAGLFAYYLASPFNLLLLLFPGEKLPLAIDWMILLKLSACGLTMALYIDGHRRLRPVSLLFTTAYALCGYNTAYGWCSMWLDAVILLPLIALGIERLLEEDRPLLYVFSLALAIIACFYTGYMLCLFSVLYFLYRLAIRTQARRALPWKRIGRYILASLGAGALSAFVLLPGVLALSGGVEISPLGFIRVYTYPAALYVLEHLFPGRGEAFYAAHVLPVLALLALAFLAAAGAALYVGFAPRFGRTAKAVAALLALGLLLGWYFTGEKYVLRYEMDLAENLLLGKLSFGGTYYWEMYNGSPNVYVGQLTLIAALGYFFNRAIPGRERKLSLVLLALLVISLLFYLPNLFWHGFEQNNCFNFRYSFVVCFFLVLLAERSFSAPEGLRWQTVVFPGLFVLLALAITWLNRPYYIEAFLCLPTLLWLLVSAAVLLLHQKKAVLPLVMAVQLVALTVSCGLTFHYDAPYSVNSASFATSYRDLRAEFETLARTDADLYRVRKASVVFSKNDPMLFNYRGVVHFSSSEKIRTLAFMKRLGIHVLDQYWANGDNGMSRAADALLGVRYLRGTDFADYRPVDSVFSRNPYALPMAFIASPDALGSPSLGDDPFQNLNALYHALHPAGEAVFTAVLAQLERPDAETLRLRFTVPAEDPVYLYVWSSGLESLTLRGPGFEREQSGLYAPAALYLGGFTPGEALTLDLRVSDAVSAVPEFCLYQESSAALAEASAALTAEPVKLVRQGESRLSCQAELTQPGTLVLSLPQEEGWHIRLDGREITAQTALGLFLALPLESGLHSVELRFLPSGLLPGAALSASALLLTVLWALRARRRTRR